MSMTARQAARGGIGSNQYQTVGASNAQPSPARVDRFSGTAACHAAPVEPCERDVLARHPEFAAALERVNELDRRPERDIGPANPDGAAWRAWEADRADAFDELVDATVTAMNECTPAWRDDMVGAVAAARGIEVQDQLDRLKELGELRERCARARRSEDAARLAEVGLHTLLGSGRARSRPAVLAEIDDRSARAQSAKRSAMERVMRVHEFVDHIDDAELRGVLRVVRDGDIGGWLGDLVHGEG